MTKRILFLMSDTGGGHRASARAIEEAIHFLYPNAYHTLIEDVWKGYTPWPINKLPNTYPWLTGPGLPLWRLMWSGSARIPAYKFLFPTISPVLERKMLRYLRAANPDIVVSVHPFMNHLGLKMLNRAGLDIPFVTVVTDMVTIHPLWICPRVTRCLVPTEDARMLALRYGMPSRKVAVCGQPVSLKFANMPQDKTSLRQKLGLDLNRPAVLIVGGGEGFGRVYDIARTIAQTAAQPQLLVVCGRNQALQQKSRATPWEIPTHIYGFVDNMHELMAAADVLVTKAGPGTISEALIAGLPLIISGYIPGQEEGNVVYVQKNQAGVYAGTPTEIAALVREWLNPHSPVLPDMARNAARLARPNASLTIAANICELIGHSRKIQPSLPKQVARRLRHYNWRRFSKPGLRFGKSSAK
jgi:1,2-diacylglycerol 3-beta-galactosyltransferase